MANVKISALPAATTPLTGSEEAALVQTGTTVRATINDVTNAVTLQKVLNNNHDLSNALNFQGTLAGDNNAGLNNINAFGENAAQNNSGVLINALGYYSANGNSGNNINAFGLNTAANNSGDYVNAIGSNSAANNSGDNVNAFGDNSAGSNLGQNVNALGGNAAVSNSGNNVNAFGANAGNTNTFNCVNLFGPTASADADSQAVFVANGAFDNARLSYANITADRKYELPDNNGTIALSVNGVTPNATTGDVTIYK